MRASIGSIAGIIFIFTLLLVVTSVGYDSGQAFIEDNMTRQPCAVVTKKTLQGKYARQCTQIVIKGKSIMGEILLENTTGYYLRTNNAFLYLSKVDIGGGTSPKKKQITPAAKAKNEARLTELFKGWEVEFKRRGCI